VAVVVADFGGGMAAMLARTGGRQQRREDASKNVDTHAVFVSDDQLKRRHLQRAAGLHAHITNVIADLDKPSQDSP